jgi:transposase
MAIVTYFFLCVLQVGFCPLWKYGQFAYNPVKALPPKVTMKPHSDTNAIPHPHGNSLAAAGIQSSTSRQFFTMENQRAAIQYEAMCQTPVNNVLKKMQKAYGRNCLSERRIYELYNEFTSGARTSTEHCPGAGRPITASDEAHEQRLLELMRESRTWTTDELVHELGGIGKDALYKLLRKNQFRKIASQWLPHELSCEQRQARIDVCNQNLQSYNDNPEFINRIIAINES